MSLQVDRRFALAWLLASAVALVVALAPVGAAMVGGHYIPVGNDSFYHARRILDLAADPSSLREFDPLVHYPEGTVLIWPWGYDYFMSLFVRLAVASGVRADPMAILANLPPLAFPLCIALVAAICRLRGIGLAGTVVALLVTALFPLNQSLYGVGGVDHHFAEQLCVLAALASAMSWLGKPQSNVRACVTGAVLGFAPCIHNGLFIIQIPLVVALLWSWLRGQAVPRNAWVFAVTLIVGTLLAAAPSHAFRAGEFQFYTLSWFHVYFAFCVGATCTMLSRASVSRRTLLLLAAGFIAALLPVASQLLLADRFLSVSVEGAERIGEVQSVWALGVNRGSVRAVTNYYSFLILLLPATMLLCAWRAWRSVDAKDAVFWLASLLGMLLLAKMVRMHVFGSFALYLTWIAFMEEQAAKHKWQGSMHRAMLGLLLVAGAGPALPNAFVTKVAGNDPYYALTYDMYPDLARECERHPGAVTLSNMDDGNYIRYHTRCAVIANNFLLTSFHESKVRQVRALLSTPASELADKAPYVRYVLVHRQSLFRLVENGRMQFLPAGDPENPDPRLISDLINASPDDLPPRFRVLKELAFEHPQRVVFARLVAIDPLPEPTT